MPLTPESISLWLDGAWCGELPQGLGLSLHALASSVEDLQCPTASAGEVSATDPIASGPTWFLSHIGVSNVFPHSALA